MKKQTVLCIRDRKFNVLKKQLDEFYGIDNPVVSIYTKNNSLYERMIDYARAHNTTIKDIISQMGHTVKRSHQRTKNYSKNIDERYDQLKAEVDVLFYGETQATALSTKDRLLYMKLQNLAKDMKITTKELVEKMGYSYPRNFGDTEYSKRRAIQNLKELLDQENPTHDPTFKITSKIYSHASLASKITGLPVGKLYDICGHKELNFRNAAPNSQEKFEYDMAKITNRLKVKFGKNTQIQLLHEKDPALYRFIARVAKAYGTNPATIVSMCGYTLVPFMFNQVDEQKFHKFEG